MRREYSTVQTTDATPTEAHGVLVGVGQEMIAEAHVMARGAEDAYYVLRVRALGTAEGPALIGTPTKKVVFESDAGLDAEWNDSATLKVRVTGLAASTIDWDVWVDLLIE